MRSEEAYAAAKKYTDRRISEAGTGEGAKINDSSISTSETWSSDKTKKTIDEIKREIENETGCVLDVELDKSTYIMKIKLLNKNGEEVSSKCVDFPMETAFVNASFDKQNKDMTFTLESGVTVVVPLGDMVVGLVSQEDFDSLSNRFSELSSNLNELCNIEKVFNNENTTYTYTASEMHLENDHIYDVFLKGNYPTAGCGCCRVFVKNNQYVLFTIAAEYIEFSINSSNGTLTVTNKYSGTQNTQLIVKKVV